MAECRYFPECQRCNETGDSWLPCAGGADGIRCKGYEPMPDVKALEALAGCVRKMGEDYDKSSAFGLGTTFRAIADRIREACGEVVR